MRRDAALLVPAVVLVVLTSGCDFLTHEKGETDYSASPEKKANVKLVNCAAAIEGREIVVKGELVNNLPGTTDVRVDYNYTPAEKPDWGAASTENPVPMVPGKGGSHSFQKRFKMPDRWRLPDVRRIHVGIRTGIGDWSTTLYLATVDPLYCLARDTGEMDVEVLVAFVNNCEAGTQTVDFEPYIAYELPDGTTRRVSSALSQQVEARMPVQYIWTASTTPYRIDELAKLVAGVRSGGVDWNVTLRGRGQSGLWTTP